MSTNWMRHRPDASGTSNGAGSVTGPPRVGAGVVETLKGAVMGGKPSKGTPKDKRLGDNKPKPKPKGK